MNLFRMKTLLLSVGLCMICCVAHAQQSALDSAKLKSLVSEAQAFANAGHYDSAVAYAKQIIGMGVRDSSIYFLTAIALALDGKKAEAKLYYDTALAMGYDAHTQAAIMFGLNASHTDVNYDSAFAAVHPEAVRKSKHLPAGYKNAELYRIYQEDQGERMILIQEGVKKFLSSDLMFKMVHNDSIRKKEMYAMLPKLKKSRSTQDLSEAALILQHENDSIDYWNAHELAMRAFQLGDTGTDTRQLAAITLGRYLISEGKPQRYGTQSFTDEKTGRLKLYPVDPSVTDSERAMWGEPPLKDALKRAEAVYGK